MLVIAVTFVIHEAHRESFRKAVIENARISLAVEKDCLRFDVCESSDRSVVFLYEQYTDEAAFDVHLASAHFTDFNERSASWVKEKRVDRYSLVA